MKILVISNLFPSEDEPNRGVFIFQQIVELSVRNELEVFCPVAWHPLKRISGSHSETWKGIKVHYIRYFYIPKIFRFIHGYSLYWALVKAYNKGILREHPDIIYGLWIYPDCYAAALMGKKLQIPLVVSARGTDINVMAKKWPISHFVKKALQLSVAVISVSEDLKNKMVCLGTPVKKIEVVRNGINASIFYPREQNYCRGLLDWDNREYQVLYVGALRKIKGILDLIETMKKLRYEKSSKKIRLQIVGDGELKEHITSQIDQNGLSGIVSLYGAVNHSDIPIYLNAADILVLPSYNEGCPNIIIEAMNCDVSIVASNVGGIPELIGTYEKGYLVESGNPEKLKDTILYALDEINSKQNSNKRSLNIRDWSKVAYEVEAVLKASLGGDP